MKESTMGYVPAALTFIALVLGSLYLIGSMDRGEQIGKIKATQLVCQSSAKVINGDLEDACGLMLYQYGLELKDGKVYVAK